MLDETLRWTFTSKRPLIRWFEHVHLLRDRIVGYWFCLDRPSGTRIWERNQRADEIVGIEDGIIIANKRWYSCDICAPKRGCYAISLETGELLWTSHGDGFWGRLLSLAEPTWFSDMPVYVLDGKCYCWSGRVLDIHTGKLVSRVPHGEVEWPDTPETDTDILGKSSASSDLVRLSVGDGQWLSHRLAAGPKEGTTEETIATRKFHLFMTDDEGGVKWDFDLNSTGYEEQYRPYADKCRYSLPYLYMVVSEKRTTKKGRHGEVYNPSHFHLLTLDLLNGRITQDIVINRDPVDGCRFEDADEKGILVSESERTLHYFPKRDVHEVS